LVASWLVSLVKRLPEATSPQTRGKTQLRSLKVVDGLAVKGGRILLC
jgi:hypothetical protein